MSALESRSLSLSIRCYRGLLRAYPQAFLSEFEDLLCQAFADLAHRAVRSKGHWGLFVLWMRTIPDLISSVFSQRFQTNSDWRFRFRWVAACSTGVLLAALCIVGTELLFELVQRWFGVMPLHRLDIPPRPDRVWNNLRILGDTAMLGMLLGACQSWALGWTRSRRAAWMLATTSGLTLAATTMLLAPTVANHLRVTIRPWRVLIDQHSDLYFGGSALLALSVLGILQALVLVRRNIRALAWIPASAAGIFAGLSVIVVTNRHTFLFLHPTFATISIFRMIEGAAFGLVTVLPLEWILRGEMAEDPNPVGSSDLPS